MADNGKLRDWQETQDTDYLKLSIERLSQPPLKWCQQFVDLINHDICEGDKSISINDIGCNVGHFHRVLDRISVPVDYIGYDISKTYLDVASTTFRSGRFELLDVTSAAPPRIADVTIVSATLEHLANWEDSFQNILEKTKDKLLLRTFAGERSLNNLYYKPSAKLPYSIRQFTFEELSEKALSAGYSMQVKRDMATDSIPQYLGCGITRTQFVCIFKKQTAL